MLKRLSFRHFNKYCKKVATLFEKYFEQYDLLKHFSLTLLLKLFFISAIILIKLLKQVATYQHFLKLFLVIENSIFGKNINPIENIKFFFETL